MPPNAAARAQLDPAWHAACHVRQRRYEAAVDAATALLERNPYDQQVWWLKARALTLRDWIDDTEVEEEGAAEVLLDENAVAQAPRPGTSLARPGTTTRMGAGSSGPNQSVRPLSSAGRPLTGFARPGTQSGSGSRRDVGSALGGGRPGTSRPVTQSGRFVRLGTASMKSQPGGAFINVERLDLRKYASRAPLAKVLCDYLLYHEHNPKKALELAAHATAMSDFKDWWWKARLGKAYYQLGLLRDAEKQFRSAQREQPMVSVALELSKVSVRLDQPLAAVETLEAAQKAHPTDPGALLAHARVMDAMGQGEEAVKLYRRVLEKDSSSVEALACLANHAFYTDQPETSLRHYRRLLQMGVVSTELWNNLGVCCFHAGQYDMTLSCFERALALAENEEAADVWYNISNVAVGIGDLGLAYQACKVAVSVDGTHAESFNNLGVLELRKRNIDQVRKARTSEIGTLCHARTCAPADGRAPRRTGRPTPPSTGTRCPQARSNFQTAAQMAPHLYEPTYNGALLAYKLGDLQESFALANKSKEAFDSHTDTHELLKQLQNHFTMM